MKVLSLDLSTKTGFAVLTDGKLETYGTYVEGKSVSVPAVCSRIDAYSYIYRAKKIAQFCITMALKHNPDIIAIEETNRGRARFSQKQLEFVHYAVLDALNVGNLPSKISYVDTSAWRSGLKIYLSKDQRAHNKAVRQKKVRGKLTSKHLSVNYVNAFFGLALKLKDNDAADAINIALFIFNKLKKEPPAPNVNMALFDK